MNKKDSIVILIGENGVVLTIHNAKKIESKIFFKNFDEKIAKTLDKILKSYKNYKISIILDILDQSYKKKDFPLMKKGDLLHLIRREMDGDPDKNSLKNFMILDKVKISSTIKNWQVLFISTSIPENVKKILDYTYKLPNRINGIFSYPIESVNLTKRIPLDESSKKKESLNCLVMQSKVSGIRQSIFQNEQILFTRLLDYNTSDPNFIKKYEKDIYASYEYLKRIFPDIAIENFFITNIFSQETLDVIKKIKNIELNIKNFTPKQISLLIDKKIDIKVNSQNSDIILSRALFLSKKYILRFLTNHMIRSEKIYFFMRFSYFLNLLILLIIGSFSYFSISKIKYSEEMTSVVKIKKANAINELSFTNKKIKNTERDIKNKYGDTVAGEQIIDISEVYSVIKDKDLVPFHEYSKLQFISDLSLKITSFAYNTESFDSKKPKPQHNYGITLTGKLINSSGDVDDLFITYDNIKSTFANKYKDYRLTISELPRNINLAEKYYFFDIKIVIKNKK